MMPSRCAMDCHCPTCQNHVFVAGSFQWSMPLRAIRDGNPPLRHNDDVHDLTADLMAEVCHCFSTEPDPQPLSGEILQGRSANCQDGARVDIKAQGFWEHSQDAFFDIRVFNPLASSYRNRTLPSLYTSNEKEKKRQYEQRIREIEHASFTPLVLSATGGMGKAADVTYRRLAAMIAEKRDQPYNQVISLIRCMVNFSLLRSELLCIRGTRSTFANPIKNPSAINMIVSEGHVPSI